MSIKTIKPKIKKAAYKIIKSDGSPLFEETYQSKAQAAIDLIDTINGSISETAARSRGDKSKLTRYNRALKFLECRIVAV